MGDSSDELVVLEYSPLHSQIFSGSKSVSVEKSSRLPSKHCRCIHPDLLFIQLTRSYSEMKRALLWNLGAAYSIRRSSSFLMIGHLETQTISLFAFRIPCLSAVFIWSWGYWMGTLRGRWGHPVYMSMRIFSGGSAHGRQNVENEVLRHES